MRTATICGAISVLALAGCAEPLVVTVSDVTERMARPGLAEPCPRGALPAIQPDGWWSCSALTERDARALGALRKAWDRAATENRAAP